MRILVINPNTNEGVLKRLEAAAHSAAEPEDTIIAVCAASGIDLIVSEADQRKAAQAVLECATSHCDKVDGIVIGSFGDTGIDLVRDHIALPTVGIAESAMKTALALGSRPIIISFSEDMRPSFKTMVSQYGLADHNIGIYLLPSQPLPDPGIIAEVFHEALLELAQSAARENPSCLIIGGGPLAGLAKSFRGVIGFPVIDGTEEAVKLLKANKLTG